jgi:hypothetical protein
MKKAMKISGVILGIILIAALVIFIFFPGLFTYISVKRNCPHIDETIGTYKAENPELPDDFVQVRTKGLLISGPADAVYDNSKSDMIVFKKDSLTVMVLQDGSSDFSLEDNADHGHFYRSLDVKIPVTTFENMDFIRNLTAKDCLKLRGADLEIFEEFAAYKDIAYDAETVYYYDNGSISGLFCEIKTSSKSLYSFVFDYSGYEYTITVKAENQETAKQIISSVQIAE